MEESNIEKYITDVYKDTYNDVLRYIVSKCGNINDVADLIQNVYLNFYRAIKNKRKIEEPKKYLIRIARNELYRHYGVLQMAKNYMPLFSINDEEYYKEFQEDLKTENDYDEKLLCKEIWEYIKQLDMLTFKIFFLYFRSDIKIKDIGTSLNISESTVKNRLYRTMKKINDEFNI